MKIGFIGLGLMGQACTARLVGSGHEVTGYDLQPEKIEVAAKHGVWPATSPGEAASQVDCVMLSVTSTDAPVVWWSRSSRGWCAGDHGERCRDGPAEDRAGNPLPLRGVNPYGDSQGTKMVNQILLLSA